MTHDEYAAWFNSLSPREREVELMLQKNWNERGKERFHKLMGEAARKLWPARSAPEAPLKP
jgi:hypothetical protein